MVKKLSVKEKKFCAEYVKSGKKEESAVNAGYSKKTAAQAASRLLKKVNIQAEIERLSKTVEDECVVEKSVLLQECLRIATTDIREAFQEDGSLKAPKDFSDDIAHSISSIEVDELYEGVGKDREQIGYTKKIKFWDKKGALELLMKYKKMLSDIVELHDPDGLAERMRKADERLAGKNKKEGKKKTS
jgi:phage terminase small subunit